jgi:hypothetical protein
MSYLLGLNLMREKVTLRSKDMNVIQHDFTAYCVDSGIASK